MKEAEITLQKRSRPLARLGLLGAAMLAFSFGQAVHAQQADETEPAQAEQGESSEPAEQQAQDVEETQDVQETQEAAADGAQYAQERDALAQQLQEREQQLRNAQRELDALRARLPAEEGGQLDLDGALRSASVTAAAIRATRQELARAGGQDTALQESIEELAAELEREQRLVARALDANLYQVRRGDTLAGIASRFYGSSQRWQELHEANRHVLDNPDRLSTGVTLVVPR